MRVKHTVPVPADRLTVAMVMLLIAGAALGFSMIVDELRSADLNAQRDARVGPWDYIASLVAVFVLGGLSLVGPPLLLLRRTRRPWGGGRIVWFAQGTSPSLVWPPVEYHRVVHGDGRGPPTSGLRY